MALSASAPTRCKPCSMARFPRLACVTAQERSSCWQSAERNTTSSIAVATVEIQVETLIRVLLTQVNPATASNILKFLDRRPTILSGISSPVPLYSIPLTLPASPAWSDNALTAKAASSRTSDTKMILPRSPQLFVVDTAALEFFSIRKHVGARTAYQMTGLVPPPMKNNRTLYFWLTLFGLSLAFYLVFCSHMSVAGSLQRSYPMQGKVDPPI